MVRDIVVTCISIYYFIIISLILYSLIVKFKELREFNKSTTKFIERVSEKKEYLDVQHSVLRNWINPHDKE